MANLQHPARVCIQKEKHKTSLIQTFHITSFKQIIVKN